MPFWGASSAWGVTETLSGADDTGKKDTGITKTSFTMLSTYDPSGKRTINSKSCLKVRWNQKHTDTGNTNGFALKVNDGYKITALTMQVSGNGKTGTLDGISIDGTDYSGSYNAELVSNDSYTTITLSGIEATEYINFKKKSGSDDATQLYVYITVTYEAITSETPLSTSVSPTSAFITIGKTQQLTGSFTGGTFDGAWSSDNTSVATVSSTGLVTAVAAGTANITYGWDDAGNDGSATYNATATIVVLPPLTQIWSTDFTAISEDGAPYTETTFGSTFYNLENVNANFGVAATETDGKNKFYIHNGALYVFYGGSRQFAINNLVKDQYIRITSSDAITAVSGVELKGSSGNVRVFQATASGIGTFSTVRYNNIYKVEVLKDYYPPTITTQPVGASYRKNAAASALTIAALAGKGGELSYQWYSNSSNTTEGAVAIDGATATSYTPSTTAVGTPYYYCVVSESGNVDAATSDIVSFVVRELADLSATSGSIALTESWKAGSVTVTLSGEGLIDGEYNVTSDVTGVTVEPATFTVASGSVEQEFKITTTDKTAATTVITFGTDAIGVTAPTYTLTYSQSSPKRSVDQTNVTAATTWDWTNCGSASIELKNDGTTIPANGEEFLLAALPEITNDANFNSQALKVSCQWPNRGTNYYFQGNTVKFNVTVPGTVQVWFSNTSNRTDTPANRRFLYVNGVNSEVYTLNQTFTNTSAMNVSAGEVVINAFTGEDTPAATMVRINKIIFTPTAEPDDPTTEGDEMYLTTSDNMAGWRAFYDASNSYSVDANTKVYIADVDPVGAVITLKSIEGVPADVPVILHTSSSADSYKMTLTKETVSPFSYIGTNKLVYTTSAVSEKYRLGFGASGVGFYPYSGTPASGAVILDVSSASARALSIVFEDETTGISQIENGKFGMENSVYNLRGQRVAQPTKGLYIVNGKKVMFK